jgi:general secretion pathway protein C
MNAATWLEGIPAPDKWRALVLTHGPRIATWGLALALGVQAAFILTDITGSRKTPPPSGPMAAPFRSHSVNVATITGADLFGKKAAAVGDKDPVQSSIPLVLTGIISADDPRNGLAILGPNPAGTKVYAVGDNVPGGAKVHSVLADRVVLDRNGTLEYLALPKNSQGGGIPISAPPTTNALQTENPVVERMRRMMTDDPGLMADVMRPQPVFAQGKQRGYRIYPGRNRAAFTRLGLHPGDLVTAINGTPLDDPSRGQEIFRTIGSSTEAHITVMRNGQQQDLTLNMAQVAQEAESMTSGQGGPPPEPMQPGAPAEPAPTAPQPDNGQQ